MENRDYTLLVVDDNEMNRDMLSRRLARKDYGVLVAEDGEKALEIVEQQPIDLVLLDIMMPGLDGVEVLRILRRKYSPAELPVIMATAKSDSEDMVQALELGANDYVTKPLDFPVVLARVQAQLRTRAAAPPPKTGEPTAAELGPGAVLAGKYRLEEPIGEGNFGAVYRARHLDLDHDVAVKVLQPSVTAGDDALKRFRREGVAACRVKHPNAVAVSDFGVTATGVAYLVMEMLRGISLESEIKRRIKLSPQRCGEILVPVCEVLAEAHGAGLIHRDIKPANIFLQDTSRGEVVKVLDFGIAKLVGETVTAENLTAEGWVLGTPAYMAPERISGRQLDGQADVYSIGIMLYEMLAGRRPFLGSSNDPLALIMEHVNTEAPPLLSVEPSVPAPLAEVVAAAIEKDPAARPAAGELGIALTSAIARSGPAEVPTAGVPTAEVPAPSVPIDHDAPTVSLATPADERDKGILDRLMRKVRRSLSSS